MFRKIYISIVAMLISSSAVADHHETATVEDEKGCKVYNPAPQQNESISWDGQCQNGFAHGKGTLNWFINGELKERYVGELADGWAEGEGTYISDNGTRYRGQWVRSKQTGQGQIINPDGSSYQGEWLNGRPHGVGTYRAANGEITEGEWENGNLKYETDGRRI